MISTHLKLFYLLSLLSVAFDKKKEVKKSYSSDIKTDLYEYDNDYRS